jgi:hypothetical protein
MRRYYRSGLRRLAWVVYREQFGDFPLGICGLERFDRFNKSFN